MYYAIKDNAIQTITQSEFFTLDDTICVLSHEEWNQTKELKSMFQLHQEMGCIQSCKLEEYDTY